MTANAGDDVTVAPDTRVVLEGTGSTADTATTYLWTQTAGPTVTLDDAASATPAFTAPEVSSSTALTFSLSLTSGTHVSTDTVTVTVVPLEPAGAQVKKASVSGSTLTLDFWGPLDENGIPAGSAFEVYSTYRSRPSRYRDCASGCTFRGTGMARVSGATVAVTLDGAIPGGPGVSMAYSMPSSNRLRLRYASGHPIDSFTDDGPHAFLLHNRGDRTPPTLLDVTVWGGGSRASGSHLKLDFDELLNEGSVPDGRSFHITVNGERRHLFSGAPAHIQGVSLRLWLDALVKDGDRVEVSYTRASYRYTDHYGPLMDITGNLVEDFSDRASSNAEGEPVFSSAVADGTKLTVTLNEEIDPRYKGNWRVGAGEGSSLQSVPVRNAATTVAGNTLTLTLGAPVVAGQRVGIAYDGGGSAVAVRDLEGNRLAPFSEFREVTNISAPPEFAGAEVNGTTLTLAFDEPLDGGSAPAPGDFHVTVGGARRHVAAGGVGIEGAKVTLTLESAVAYGETAVTVRYTRGANPLRDRGGNEVEGSSDWTVTNVRPPAFQSAQVTGKTLTVLFDQALDPRSVPPHHRFYVLVNGRPDNVEEDGVAIDGSKVTLTLWSVVAETDTVTVSYGKRENPLRDRAGNEVADFSKRPVTWVEGPPAVESAVVNGVTLTLTFDQDLDGDSVPAPGRFRVTVDNVPRNVASGGVAIEGATVTLTLSNGGGARRDGHGGLHHADQQPAAERRRLRRRGLRRDGDLRRGAGVPERGGERGDAHSDFRPGPGRGLGARARRPPRHRGQRSAQRRQRRRCHRRRDRDADAGNGGGGRRDGDGCATPGA